MSRSPRYFLSGVPLHIIQRGNNKIPCFHSDRDRAFFMAKLLYYSSKYQVAIHSFVLMTNHVHLLVTPTDTTGISRCMQALGTCYVKYFNDVHKRTGTLWEGRFRACLVDSEEYFLVVSRYIELNPVRAGMVKHPDEYSWSSYRSNAMGYEIKLLTPHPLYLALGQDDQERQKSYQALFGSYITDSAVNEIRTAINKSNILGNAHFKRNLVEKFGQCIGHLQMGGDRKSANFKSGGQVR